MINHYTTELWIARDPKGNLRIFGDKPTIVTKREMKWTGEYDDDNPYGHLDKVYEPIGPEYQVMESSYYEENDNGIIVEEKFFPDFKNMKIGDKPVLISINKQR